MRPFQLDFFSLLTSIYLTISPLFFVIRLISLNVCEHKKKVVSVNRPIFNHTAKCISFCIHHAIELKVWLSLNNEQRILHNSKIKKKKKGRSRATLDSSVRSVVHSTKLDLECEMCFAKNIRTLQLSAFSVL